MNIFSINKYNIKKRIAIKINYYFHDSRGVRNSLIGILIFTIVRPIKK